MTPTVYLETTIPSYLTAALSADPLREGKQRITREWWAQRDSFELYVSRLVATECSAGNQEAAAARLAAIADLPILEQTGEVDSLSKLLIRDVPLPVKAETDAIHIAVAAVNGIRHLLTWNCAHIANANFRPRIEAICRAAGYDHRSSARRRSCRREGNDGRRHHPRSPQDP